MRRMHIRGEIDGMGMAWWEGIAVHNMEVNRLD